MEAITLKKEIKNPIKIAKFKVIESSAKKYLNEEGVITLTKKHVYLKGDIHLEKNYLIEHVRLASWKGHLEINDSWYGKLYFKLSVDEPQQWRDAFNEIIMEGFRFSYADLFNKKDKLSTDLKKIFELDELAFKKLYNTTKKERVQFQRKNIKFNLDIQRLYENKTIRNRKLKAFLIAHNYNAWYEWTKRILEKLYKAKFGKGPTSSELFSFLNNYPTVKEYLDTSDWGLDAKDIRNCIAHELFYFDYKNSELIFMIKNREKNVKIRDLWLKIIDMSRFYSRLLGFIAKKGAENN